MSHVDGIDVPSSYENMYQCFYTHVYYIVAQDDILTSTSKIV